MALCRDSSINLNELIQAGLADRVRKEDLAILQRLQEDFKTLQNRVDQLEARTAKLETQLFSTTTRLRGQNVFAVNAGFGKNIKLYQLDSLF